MEAQTVPDKFCSLARFLAKSKKQAWAGDGKKTEPQRPGFEEHEFIDGDWEYGDSFSGFYFFHGQETVKFQKIPLWTMSYSGGMLKAYHGNLDFAE